VSIGLTESEAAHRLAERPRFERRSSRSTASIVRGNVLTPFNAILVGLGALTLAFSDWRDALFLGIVIANATIGIWQEMRAKRALDALAALVEPQAAVVRDGEARQLHVDEMVVGDLVRLAPGGQVVADGLLVESSGLLVDESILTGESRPVERAIGEQVRSGSFVVEGAAAYLVAAVGADSYAERVAGTAREFRHPRSPLERSIVRLLYVLLVAMVPLASMLVVALWKQDVALRHAIDTAVAGMVTLIPEGLILLVSVTFAAAAVRLARAGALAQQLNAIESLAAVDTLCIDKTGTLTEPWLRVVDLVPAGGVDEPELAWQLGRYAASSSARDHVLDALHAKIGGEAEATSESVPFLARRRWSALAFGSERLVLGAPEHFELGALAEEAARRQSGGLRLLAFGRATGAFPAEPEGGPPASELLGLVVLAEELRVDARETIAFLLAEGVDVKVLSGDDVRTATAIARDVGLVVDELLEGADLPAESRELAALAPTVSVVGRISPEDKRRFVEALAARGRYVAMVGDGVNDVPALKASRLAFAQGTGADMTRAVSDIVLVSGDFSAVPRMVAEGRQILRNIQRVAKLFVAKSVFAAFLIVAVGLTPTEYPLLPRHLTVIGALTVGIPAFFLALAPSEGPWRTDRFLREVARFSVPAGVAAGLGVITTYLVALNVFALGVEQSRTAATSTLVLVGLYLVLALEATSTRRARWVGLLCGALLAAYIALLSLGPARTFFELEAPGAASLLLIAFGAAVAIGFLWLTDERFVPLRRAADEEGTGTMAT
jgi:cation-transporting ATPase E